MEKILVVSGKTIAYRMKRNRGVRSVRISVSCSGAVSVVVPWFVPDILAERFICSRADWILRKLAEFSGRESSCLLSSGKREYEGRKAEALAFVAERVAYWNRIYGFRYGAISVRNQKTRWGSCSKKGDLSFNWRLLLLPPEMADYVVVHELCHLAHFDHSGKFWSLVARTVPDHRDIRRRMKRI
jgi:predicted metal-dependent hydrolase